jgi:D-psicose/D-tagatose/L-ribulose 3-epimerase
MASQMGAANLCGMLYGVHKCFPAGVAAFRGALLENSAASLREVALSACEHGVRLSVEAVNRFESPIINTAEEAVLFVRQIDSPAAGVHLDTFHMNIEEDDPPAAIRLAAQHLAHVHISENNRKLPGRGHLPWRTLLAALQEAGYRDDIVIEALPFPYGSVSDRLHIWRRLIDADVDVELQTAVGYLRGLLWEQDGGGTRAADRPR